MSELFNEIRELADWLGVNLDRLGCDASDEELLAHLHLILSLRVPDSVVSAKRVKLPAPHQPTCQQRVTP